MVPYACILDKKLHKRFCAEPKDNKGQYFSIAQTTSGRTGVILRLRGWTLQLQNVQVLERLQLPRKISEEHWV